MKIEIRPQAIHSARRGGFFKCSVELVRQVPLSYQCTLMMIIFSSALYKQDALVSTVLFLHSEKLFDERIPSVLSLFLDRRKARDWA